MGMTESDWTSAETLAMIAAEELGSALEALGIRHHGCYVSDDGDVNVAFQDIRDAETMVSLGVPAEHDPGTLYDRATASCVTLAELGASGDPAEGDILAAMEAGWTWTIHPAMNGRRMDWHVSVDMTVADAHQLTANLNTVRLVRP